MFEIGQQVVCIKGKWRHAYLKPEQMNGFPVRGCVYTIRDYALPGPDFVLLAEILNPTFPSARGPYEPGFYECSFRPVRKTSIDVFTELLVTPPRKLVDA